LGELIRPFSNAFSLIICKVHTKRENTGSWNSGPEKARQSYLFCTIPNKLKLHGEFFMDYLKIIGANNYQRGPTRWAQPTWARQGAQARPGGLCPPQPPLVPLFWYISHFDLEKIRRGLRNEAPPSRGGTWAGALLPYGGAISSGELPSRRGKSSSSSSPNNSPIFARAISINIFNNTISSQTLVHLLCSIFVSEP